MRSYWWPVRVRVNFSRRGLECVGTFPLFFKLFDRHNEASSCDHIDHGKDPWKQSGVGKINDGAFQLIC